MGEAEEGDALERSLNGHHGRLGEVELLSEVKKGLGGVACSIPIHPVSPPDRSKWAGGRRGDEPSPCSRTSRFRSLLSLDGAYWNLSEVDLGSGANFFERGGWELEAETGETVMGTNMADRGQGREGET